MFFAFFFIDGYHKKRGENGLKTQVKSGFGLFAKKASKFDKLMV